MTEPDGSVTDSESAGPGAAPAATQARWVAVARCRGARAPVTETPLSPPGRTRPARVGARIYFRAVESTSDPESSPRQSARRHACQLSDLKARESARRAAAGDWAVRPRLGVMATDGLVPHSGRARIEKGRFRGLGWRLWHGSDTCALIQLDFDSLFKT
jgi:uncharacterized protein involved in high-affinity Fe2+ transport